MAANASAVADTINLPAGIYTLTMTGPGEDAAATGDLDLSGDVMIQGAGAAGTTVDGNLADRVFDVAAAGIVTLSNLTVRNGSVVGTGSTADGLGGGIRSVGALSLIGSVVTDNRAVGADKPSATSVGTAYGGGIYQVGGGINLLNSTVQNNRAIGGALTSSDSDVLGGGAFGGGVYVRDGVVTVSLCVVTGNEAVGGDAVRTDGGSAVTGGEAAGGGMMLVNSSDYQIISSTIAGNRAAGGVGTGQVGGVGSVGVGGGLWLSGVGTVGSSTISGNRAVGGVGNTTGAGTGGSGGNGLGGGVVALGGLITNSTISANAATGGTSNRTAGTGTGGGFAPAVGQTSNTAFRSTILAGNSATTSADIVRPQTGVTASQGNNLIGSGAGAPDFIDGLNGDQVGTAVARIDPQLGPLANNGGPTPTHVPAVTSPAINRGWNSNFLATDQRGSGFSRVSGASADVGAVELTYPLPWATVSVPTVPLGGTQLQLSVIYRDDRGLAVGTLGTGDLRVTGPNGFSVIPEFSSVDAAAEGTPRTATYTFTPPGGTWDATDNGTYTVSVQSGQIGDIDGNFAAAGPVGTLQVSLPIVVLNANDSGPGSLRQALLDANARPGPDAIAFDPAFFSTARTVTLTSGPLSITDSVTVAGPGAAFVTLNGDNRDRILGLTNGTANSRIVTLSGLTFTGGKAVGGGGGAIVSTGYYLTVRDSVFTGNSADSGGAIQVQPNASVPGALTVVNSVFTNNTAAADGGAVSAASGLGGVNLIGSTFSGNTAAGRGGAISAVGSGATNETFTADRSTFASNTAGGGTLPGGGGGLYVSQRQTSITGTTFSGNLARSGPGGGAWVVYSGIALVQDSTFSGNAAGHATSGTGGGLYLDRGTLGTAIRVWNSTIVGNQANGTNGAGGLFLNGTAQEVRSSIVTGNTGSGAADIQSTSVLLTESAVGSSTGFTLATGSGNNLPFGTDVRLGALADNGGPTKTHALLAGSPALNVGSNPGGLLIDQRGYGFSRTVGAGTDIGAFETVPSGLPTATAGPLPDVAIRGGTAYDFTVTFRDDVAVNIGSLGTGDVRVTGPNGFMTAPELLGVDLNTSGTPRQATYRLTPPGGMWDAIDAGMYTVDLSANGVADTAGNMVPAVRLGQFTAAPPTGVTSTVINDGSRQRSRVMSVTVYFDGPLEFLSSTAETFRVRRPDGADVPFTAVPVTVSAGTAIKLTFSGPGLESGSLADGNYTLTVLGSTARSGTNGPLLDADGEGQPGGDYTLQFHRLYGDINADKAVNGLDLAAFRVAFGRTPTDPNYLAELDFNGDGAINGLDLAPYRTRFGTALP